MKKHLGCEGCRYVSWMRTKSGARHPNGRGECGWHATFKVPPLYPHPEGGTITIKPGRAVWKDMDFECPVKEWPDPDG